jgi:hypothetical protein
MINDVDVVFHDILLQKAMRQDGDSYTGYKLRDSSAHAQLVGLYATQAESVRSDLERQSRASEEVVAISTGHELRGGSALIEVNKQKPVNPLLIPRLNGEFLKHCILVMHCSRNVDMFYTIIDCSEGRECSSV